MNYRWIAAMHVNECLGDLSRDAQIFIKWKCGLNNYCKSKSIVNNLWCVYFEDHSISGSCTNSKKFSDTVMIVTFPGSLMRPINVSTLGWWRVLQSNNSKGHIHAACMHELTDKHSIHFSSPAAWIIFAATIVLQAQRKQILFGQDILNCHYNTYTENAHPAYKFAQHFM